MGYLSNIKKLYLFRLFQALILAYVIERLFWHARGMTVQMVVYCEIIFAATVILCEIPSGILADKFGRKRMLVLDGMLSVLEIGILLFATNFWMFGLAVFLSGIGKALSSGSENALLYDSLLAENREGDFEKILGRLSAVDFGGALFAALSGGVLADFFKMEYNYIVSLFSMLIAFFIALTLKEPPLVTKPEGEWINIWQHTKRAVSVFKPKPMVFLYCMTGAVLGACLIYLDEFWQLIMQGIGVPIFLFGVVSASIFLFRLPGNLFAYKLKERFSYRKVLIVILAVNIAGYAAIFFTRSFFCLIPMICVFFTAGITEPLITGYLHHRTDSNVRATVESFFSLGLRLISVLVGLVFGYIGTKHSIFSGFAFISLVCLAYVFPYGYFLRKHK